MRPIIVSAGPLAADDPEAIFESAVIGSAGPLTLDGDTVVDGVAHLDVARQVLFTFAADETGTDFTVTGTNWSGAAISEVVAGETPGTAPTTLDYLTVTGVTASAASAGDVSIGTSLEAGSPWVRLDDWAPANISIQITVAAGGIGEYTLQSTLDDPNDPTNPVAPADVAWINSSDTAVVGVDASAQTNYLFAPRYVRVLFTGMVEGAGAVTMTVLQSSNGP